MAARVSNDVQAALLEAQQQALQSSLGKIEVSIRDVQIKMGELSDEKVRAEESRRLFRETTGEVRESVAELRAEVSGVSALLSKTATKEDLKQILEEVERRAASATAVLNEKLVAVRQNTDTLKVVQERQDAQEKTLYKQEKTLAEWKTKATIFGALAVAVMTIGMQIALVYLKKIIG